MNMFRLELQYSVWNFWYIWLFSLASVDVTGRSGARKSLSIAIFSFGLSVLFGCVVSVCTVYRVHTFIYTEIPSSRWQARTTNNFIYFVENMWRGCRGTPACYWPRHLFRQNKTLVLFGNIKYENMSCRRLNLKYELLLEWGSMLLDWGTCSMIKKPCNWP